MIFYLSDLKLDHLLLLQKQNENKKSPQPSTMSVCLMGSFMDQYYPSGYFPRTGTMG